MRAILAALLAALVGHAALTSDSPPAALGTGTSGLLGDGSDGPRTYVSSTVDTPIDSPASGLFGTTALSATNPLFASGQRILIHQSRGNGAGAWEVNEIQAYSGGTITTTNPLVNDYFTDPSPSAAGLLESVPCEENADVNADGRVNGLDSTLILQFDAGLIARLGPGVATVTPRPTRTLTPQPPTPTNTAPPTGSCHPSYVGVCLDPNAVDYDCQGGSGNGPLYVRGAVPGRGPGQVRARRGQRWDWVRGLMLYAAARVGAIPAHAS